VNITLQCVKYIVSFWMAIHFKKIKKIDSLYN